MRLRTFDFFMLGFSIFFLDIFTFCSDIGPIENELRITATDEGYEFQDSIAAGMTHIIFENKGSTNHEALFTRLPEGMSGEDYIMAVRNGMDFPEGALDYSGPGLTSPGEKVELWLHLHPGEYILGCWFRSHLTSIPVQKLMVYENMKTNVKPPDVNATLKLKDYQFELEGKLQKGPQILRVEMTGPSMHEVDIFRLNEDSELEDLRDWQKNGKRGAAPAVAIGGVLDSHDINKAVWLKVNFLPGRYVFWCGLPMVMNDVASTSEITHADAGMIKEFIIEE